MKASQWYKILVTVALLLVTGFQVYWLKDTYNRERQALTVKTTGMFNDMVRSMQDSALQARIPIIAKADTLLQKQHEPVNTVTRIRPSQQDKDLRIARVAAALQHQTKRLDSLPIPGSIMITIMNDSLTLNTSTKAILDSLTPDKISRLIFKKGGRMKDSLNDLTGLHFFDTVRTAFYKADSKNIKNKPRPKGNVVTLSTATSWQSTTPSKEPQVRPRARYAEPTQFTFVLDSLFKGLLSDTVVYNAFSKLLVQEKISVDFNVSRSDSTDNRPAKRRGPFPGANDQNTYKLQLADNTGYLLNNIKLPILFSLLLVGVTFFSFLLLYRNWKKQKRLTDIKNEFISNITHELKTPIATVGVAMEALSNFNALNNPERAKEYIDISKQELSRLSLLVDKVLKLSMFENKEIELQKSPVDLREITQEVIGSMRLQIEKRKAVCQLEVTGNPIVKGDRMHLLSVVYNLLDNALKYGSDKPVVQVTIRAIDQSVQLQVADNGIGIPPEYTGKIFDKFFRVPHGDTHTAKGYGLGLSYVWQVVQKHGGTIEVFSKPEQGTTFTISLPKLLS
jgi:two-component system phosphate regulon sensor histidine kinase PhoR